MYAPYYRSHLICLSLFFLNVFSHFFLFLFITEFPIIIVPSNMDYHFRVIAWILLPSTTT